MLWLLLCGILCAEWGVRRVEDDYLKEIGVVKNDGFYG